MAAVLFTTPDQQFFDANGDPLAGGKLYTYAAGTLTPKATYTDAGGLTPNTNPVVLDSAGRAIIFITGSYKFILKDSLDNTIWTVDNVTAFATSATIADADYGDVIVSGSGTVWTLDTTGVVAGSYTSLNATIDAKGRITSASSGGSAPFNYIGGFLPSGITGTSTTGALTVSAGQAASSTNTATISKTTTTSWAVSNGNNINGYSGGTTLPNSATIHFFICTGGTGTGVFASNSLTPTFPTGYDSSTRRIFSLNTTSAGALRPGTAIETDGGGMLFWLTTQLLDVNAAPAAAGTTYTLTVPSGVKMQPIYRAMYTGSSAGDLAIILAGDETSIAPSGANFSVSGTVGYSAIPGYDVALAAGNTTNVSMLTNDGTITTNASGQIIIRGNGSSGGANTLSWITRGWKDYRRA